MRTSGVSCVPKFRFFFFWDTLMFNLMSVKGGGGGYPPFPLRVVYDFPLSGQGGWGSPLAGKIR